jgi:hypothetical protein
MALRAVLEHPKFADLQSELKLSKYAILGILEAVWHFCAKFTQEGNIGKYQNRQIAAWIGWDGEPDQLIIALVRTGWLDEHPIYRLVVHDWASHADNATKKSVARAKVDFVRTLSGHRPRDLEPVQDMSGPPEPEPEPEP